MSILPIFKLFSADKPEVVSRIQPTLEWRSWRELTDEKKKTMFQELVNRGWIVEYAGTLIKTIEYLNKKYLRKLPGKRLHAIPYTREYGGYDNSSDRQKAALGDFCQIFFECEEDVLVFEMITKFAQEHIDHMSYGFAEDAEDDEKRQGYIKNAFEKFDALSNCFNNIFEQFAVNVVLTRNGLIPRQDNAITKSVFEPVLTSLSDPKWHTVNKHLSDAMKEYMAGDSGQSIASAHSAVQAYFQVILGEEGKNGKGEFGKLFSNAKSAGLIPATKFSETIMNGLGGFIVSERATKSKAKPKSAEATAADALLVINSVMIFLQYCQQEAK